MFAKGERDTAKIREAFKKAGVPYEKVLKLLQSVDPLNCASGLNPKKTWLYSATGDRVVPARNAKALADAASLDSKHHIWFPGNHYTGVLFLPQIMAHMRAEILR